ncbi:MAG: nitrous oxide reductase accessory protein NosL [Hyphomicrobiaceae bacterium]|nr:nitrous oxide reductase accessory protein NosL [Hyphomicrobiaceae bacterium]
MRDASIIALTFLAVAMVTGCKENGPPPGAVEITDDATGYFCMMNISEHAGPKAQIHLSGIKKPLFFPSVVDAVAYLMLPGEDKAVRAIYVNDMGKATNWQSPEPGTWIDAYAAYFVIGSKRLSGMGHEEAVPFGTREQAESFIGSNGGRLVQLAQIPSSYVFPSLDAKTASSSPELSNSQNSKETTR